MDGGGHAWMGSGCSGGQPPAVEKPVDAGFFGLVGARPPRSRGVDRQGVSLSDAPRRGAGWAANGGARRGGVRKLREVAAGLTGMAATMPPVNAFVERSVCKADPERRPGEGSPQQHCGGYAAQQGADQSHSRYTGRYLCPQSKRAAFWTRQLSAAAVCEVGAAATAAGTGAADSTRNGDAGGGKHTTKAGTAL